VSKFKLLALVGVSVVALVVAGCGSSSKKSTTSGKSAATTVGKGEIAVLLPDTQSSVRWEQFDRKYLDQAFTAAGITHTIVNAQGDPSTQRTQAEQAITNGAKVILLVDLDPGSGAAIISLAHQKGVKVIDYDRLTLGGGADYYVSFNNTRVGQLQGQGLVKCIQQSGLSKPVVAELNGSPTDNNATLFASGYNSVLSPLYKTGTLVKGPNQSVPMWDNQQALTIFEQMLQRTSNKINAVLAANDGLANSVISAETARKLKYVPVTGQDATLAGIQHILAGPERPGQDHSGAAGDPGARHDGQHQADGHQGRVPRPQCDLRRDGRSGLHQGRAVANTTRSGGARVRPAAVRYMREREDREQ
jgi:D-xylose transport system substrate-binding protein